MSRRSSPMHPSGAREALLWAMTGLDKAMTEFAVAFAAAADPELTSPPAARAVVADLAKVSGDLEALRVVLVPHRPGESDEGVA